MLRSVVLAGGGTGGHIEPALALADCLRRHESAVAITCLGTPKGLEAEMIPARGWDLELIPAYPLPRKPNLDLLRTPSRIARSVAAARRVLDAVDAQVVVGFGGYVALPAYLAARRKGIPLVVHEVNNPAGLANRVGARMTPFVALGGEQVQLRGGEVVGVPLRRAISTLDRNGHRVEARKHFGLREDLPTLLVFGGSQGARSVNVAVADAVPRLTGAGIQVLHVIGARNSLDDIPTGVGAPYVTVPFIESMDLAYAAADLALCRGGALTCAELTAVGLPAVYVPLPWGNGEQRRNAAPIVDAGGGLLADDADMTADWVVSTVTGLVESQRLAQMGEAAAAFGRRDGDERLRSMVLRAVGASAGNSSPML